MKIAFYKAIHGNLLDYIIAIVTLKKHSHCEIVFSDGLCASSSPRDDGVRFKDIFLGHKWDVYELSQEFSEEYARAWFKRYDHQKYDRKGAIGSWLHLNWASNTKKFCSYACADALRLDKKNITPGALFHYMKKKKLLVRKVSK